jgi:4-diphosphocytidyl-2-C-methyl-D-erythritol kinase
MIAYSPAKINIGLHILNKRVDGYHNIHSYIYPIPLFDIIEIKESVSDQLIQTGFRSTPDWRENIIYKSLALLRKEINVPPLKIHLHKQIPVGSGLGGGSSNAISFLKLIIQYFSISVKPEFLSKLAEKLGSDCPFFIQCRPSEISGTGNQINILKWSLRGIYICIVMPNSSISTSKAYKKIVPYKKTLVPIVHADLNDYFVFYKNQFENYAMDTIPELIEIKKQLISSGSFFTSLTGSGSAIYGLFYQNPNIQFNKAYFVWSGVLN